jgi:hypothetical protein
MRLVHVAAALSIVATVATGSASLSEPQKFGAGVSLTTSTPIASVLENPDAFAGKTVRVEGTVTAVCAHEGCWMALAPEGQADGPTLRLKVDDGVIVFPVTAKGKKAVAQGVLERVGGDAESREAASEHAKHSATALSETSRHWQVKATGALVY